MNIEFKENQMFVTLDGNMTIFNGETLKNDLVSVLCDNHNADCIVLDLSKVDEFDSSGLQLLLAFQTALAQEGKPLNITSVNPCIMGVLDLYDMTESFDIGH
jgi:anti-anti-sigma factor